MPAVSWGLVVPVKRLVLAKTRLSSYGDAARQDLALAFALDVVAAALAAPSVVQVLVVSPVRSRAAVRIIAAIAQIAHDPTFGFVDHARSGGLGDIAAEPRQRIGLRNDPPHFLDRPGLQGMLQHRQPDFKRRRD